VRLPHSCSPHEPNCLVSLVIPEDAERPRLRSVPGTFPPAWGVGPVLCEMGWHFFGASSSMLLNESCQKDGYPDDDGTSQAVQCGCFFFFFVFLFFFTGVREQNSPSHWTPGCRIIPLQQRRIKQEKCLRWEKDAHPDSYTDRRWRLSV